VKNRREYNASISGNGNIVGDGNSVVYKSQKNIHNHGGRDKDADDSKHIFFGLMCSAALGCAIVSYFFAQHAQAIYVGLRVASGLEFVLSVALALLVARNEQGWFSGKAFAVMLLSAIASLVLHFAHSSYREDLTQLALASSGAVNFWCSLSQYGHQVALLHAATAFGALLACTCMTMPLIDVAMMEVSGEVFKLRKLATVLLAVSAPLVFGVGYLHSNAGWESWTELVKAPPTFFCPTR
jgi:hypothetical protein